jgi:hypothetical protein
MPDSMFIDPQLPTRDAQYTNVFRHFIPIVVVKGRSIFAAGSPRRMLLNNASNRSNAVRDTGGIARNG